MNKADMRKAIAKARDAWLESPEGERCCDGQASGYYLRNRIEAAFCAGYNASEKACEEDIKS